MSAAEDEAEPGTQQQFLALCVPASSEAVSAAERNSLGEEDFRWVREFAFSSHKDLEGARSFAISLKPEAALYAPLRANYMLGKRKRQDFANIPVPKKVRPALPPT